MFGRQPVVDGHHDRAGAHGMLAAGAVVGVEVADDEATAVKIQYDGRCCPVPGISWWPIDPDSDGACRPLDRPVFDPQLWVHRPAWQVAKPLARRIDPILH